MFEGGSTCTTSLSYVILQLEAPRLLEEHFGEERGANAVESDAVRKLAARLDALG